MSEAHVPPGGPVAYSRRTPWNTTPLTPEREAALREMHAAGAVPHRIAAAMRVGVDAAERWHGELGLVPNRRAAFWTAERVAWGKRLVETRGITRGVAAMLGCSRTRLRAKAAAEGWRPAAVQSRRRRRHATEWPPERTGDAVAAYGRMGVARAARHFRVTTYEMRWRLAEAGAVIRPPPVAAVAARRGV